MLKNYICFCSVVANNTMGCFSLSITPSLSPHLRMANISHVPFALLENQLSLNSVLMPEKKISSTVSREAAFDYSNLEEMKGFICGNWDIRCCLLREAGFFFFNHPSTPTHTPKINKIPENTLIFYITGNLPSSGAIFLLSVVHFMP